ncbi:MAG: ATP-dependent Clp protease adaptor ClpS [Vicinamibacterales bacterium]|nr:ATP-dependent Clp protease adaptor ClpS [Vicinamibacterales bacterium]
MATPAQIIISFMQGRRYFLHDPFHWKHNALICLAARNSGKGAPPIMETTTHPKERGEREHQADGEKLTELIQRYHVVLLDDEDHTYQYVVEMLMRLFRHGRKMSWKMASEVDQRGRVIVFTTNKEQAEHKRSQIQSWGADKRLVGSKGSMSAIVEKAD